ncbi:hypothetical protein WN943_015355 [Citrus x changshan-huyou]
MYNDTFLVIQKILEAYMGFNQIKQLVDVCGCLGSTYKAITSDYPHIKGINFDLPHVIKHDPNCPGILGRAPTVGDTFKPVPQPRLEVPARTERHRFSQQRRLPCDSNWGANSIKSLKETPLPVEPTLCWLLDHDPPPPLLLDHNPSPPRLLDHELSPMIFQIMTQVRSALDV